MSSMEFILTLFYNAILESFLHDNYFYRFITWLYKNQSITFFILGFLSESTGTAAELQHVCRLRHWKSHKRGVRVVMWVVRR